MLFDYRILLVLATLGCSSLIGIKASRVAVCHTNNIRSEGALDTLSSQLNEKTIAVYTFGFEGNKKRKRLFDSICNGVKTYIVDRDDKGLPDVSCLMLDGADPVYLREAIDTGSVVIGYLPKALLGSDVTSFLAHVQYFVDGVFAKKAVEVESYQLVVLVEGALDSPEVADVQSLVRTIIEDSAHPQKNKVEVKFVSITDSGNINSSSSGNSDSIETEATSEADTTATTEERRKEDIVADCMGPISSVINAVRGSPTLPLITNIFRIAEKTASSSSSSTSTTTSAEEVDASYDCNIICDRFVETFRAKIANIERALNAVAGQSLSMASIATTVDAVDKALRETVESNYEENALYFSQHSSSKALHRVARRARIEITASLLFIYDCIVTSLYNGHMDALDKAMAKVRPAYKYPRGLRSAAKAQMRAFDDALHDMQKAFEELVRMQVEEGGLFSHNEHLWSSSDFVRLFCRRSYSQRFARQAVRAAAEKQDKMFLEGLYNPFVREAPYPPTHFNFNYLVSPRALAQQIREGGAYDEHFDGVSLDRADPLLFPGITTTIPFDPNVLPKAKDTDPKWTELVTNFFKD